MPLADEMTFQRIETLLDMRFKKLHEEIKSLKDEVSAVRDDLRKVQQTVHERAPESQPAYQQQQQWQPPQQQQQWAQQPPQQSYPQQQAAPTNRYSGQFDAPSAPHQQAPPQQQAAPAAPARNKWIPPPDKAPVNEPIDRNGVAPADVTIEKFFYMGNKKK